MRILPKQLLMNKQTINLASTENPKKNKHIIVDNFYSIKKFLVPVDFSF